MSSPIEQLVRAISDVVNSDRQWRVVSSTGMLVRAIPNALEAVLPALGAVKAAPGSTWLTLDFWIQGPEGGLGVFWRANPVADLNARNRALKALLDDGERTGFVYQGTRGPWGEIVDPAFSGRTVSSRWWPQGSAPDIAAARDEVRRQLAIWTVRLPLMTYAIGRAAPRKP